MRTRFVVAIRAGLITMLLLVTGGLVVLSWVSACPCCRF
jgi:hypothetical protein